MPKVPNPPLLKMGKRGPKEYNKGAKFSKRNRGTLGVPQTSPPGPWRRWTYRVGLKYYP